MAAQDPDSQRHSDPSPVRSPRKPGLSWGQRVGGAVTIALAAVFADYGRQAVQYRSAVESEEQWNTHSPQPSLDGNQPVPEISGEVETVMGDSFGGSLMEERNPYEPRSGQNRHDLGHELAEIRGTTPVSLIHTGYRSEQILADQVQRIPSNSRRVILSVGANERYSKDVPGQPDSYISITDVIRDCLMEHIGDGLQELVDTTGRTPTVPECERVAAAAWDRALVELPDRVTPLIEAIRQRVPGVPIYLVSPSNTLASQQVTQGCVGMSADMVNFLASSMPRLSASIGELGRRTGTPVIDLNANPELAGRRACDPGAESLVEAFNWVGAVNNWASTLAPKQIQFWPAYPWLHPNREGVRINAEYVSQQINEIDGRQWLPGRSTTEPSGTARRPTGLDR